MKPVFADTSFYLAVLNPRDAWHPKAVELAERLETSVITSYFVLVELGSALSRGHNRLLFIDLVAGLKTDAATRIVSASAPLIVRGIGLFGQRQDKEWSVTDCISFLIMTDEELTDVLTADHHFEQAGFTVLLK